ncbi:MAG TPA: response regulator [Mucilaginibacter sp.]
MMNIEFSFIIVDDSELDCYVTKKFLELTNDNVIVKPFHNANDALKFIQKNDSGIGTFPTIILLDLQMPGMTGFNFVEEFEKLSTAIQENYIVIILTVLSFTSDPNNIQRILRYRVVNSVIEKPLTQEKLLELLNQVS